MLAQGGIFADCKEFLSGMSRMALRMETEDQVHVLHKVRSAQDPSRCVQETLNAPKPKSGGFHVTQNRVHAYTIYAPPINWRHVVNICTLL